MALTTFKCNYVSPLHFKGLFWDPLFVCTQCSCTYLCRHLECM